MNIHWIWYWLLLYWLQHAGHTFLPLDDVYKTNMSIINEHIQQLKRRHVEFICLIQDIVCVNIWKIYLKIEFIIFKGTKYGKSQSKKGWKITRNSQYSAYNVYENWWTISN
jgi:hypothetical protein